MREGQERAPVRAQNMAEIAIRGTALLWDLQVDATRNLLRAQARTASMFGVPDYSALFRIADMRARRVFTETAEQVISTAREATRTVTGVQRELGRLAEQQTIEMTEEVRENVQQLSSYAQRGLEEIQGVAQQEADEVRRGLDESGDRQLLEQRDGEDDDERQGSAQDGEQEERGNGQRRAHAEQGGNGQEQGHQQHAREQPKQSPRSGTKQGHGRGRRSAER